MLEAGPHGLKRLRTWGDGVWEAVKVQAAAGCEGQFSVRDTPLPEAAMPCENIAEPYFMDHHLHNQGNEVFIPSW